MSNSNHRAVIYVRVSDPSQVKGTSLDNQRRACLEDAQNQLGISEKNTEISVEEGESATAANRTQFLRAIDYCQKHKRQTHAFIVWKIDRLNQFIPVYKQLVDRILQDKSYAGILVDPWAGREYQGLHKPMITIAEYEKIHT